MFKEKEKEKNRTNSKRGGAIVLCAKNYYISTEIHNTRMKAFLNVFGKILKVKRNGISISVYYMYHTEEMDEFFANQLAKMCRKYHSVIIADFNYSDINLETNSKTQQRLNRFLTLSPKRWRRKVGGQLYWI